MRRALVLVVLASACGTRPPPPPDTTTHAGAAPGAAPRAPTASSSAKVEEAAPPLALRPGWTVIASAPRGNGIAVFESSDGSALLALEDAGRPGVAKRWFRALARTIEPDPPLAKGLTAVRAFDARSPDNAVIAVEKDGGCEVRAWASGAMTAIGATTRAEGGCAILRAWTPGAAVVVTDAEPPRLVAFGKLQSAAPVLAPVGPKPCELRPQVALAWETGELAVAGIDCEPAVWVEAFGPRAARPVSARLPLDYNVPLFGLALPDGEMEFEGSGTLPKAPNDEVGVLQRMTFDGTQIKKGAAAPSPQHGEILMSGAEAARDLATTDTSLVPVAAVRGGETIYFVGTRQSGRTVVLRNAPVDAPLEL
ncbi:MAG: hypothetical protein U0414_24905 [Polyangiaceae bacterium]